MRLFISYARIDKPYCLQIIDTLEVHEIWYDHRLYAGQQWWKEILRRLEWCEGFIYLLSPDSVTSEYCRREFNVASELDKLIFPILIDDQTPVPMDLQQLQYVNFSKGLTPESVKTILNSIYIEERALLKSGIANGGKSHTPESIVDPPSANPVTVIADAAAAFDKGDYDRVIFLLTQVREKGFESRFIDVEAWLHEAEQALEQRSLSREAARSYKQIAVLVKHERTRGLGCEAYQNFRETYPDYSDLEGLSKFCAEYLAAQDVPVFPIIPQSAPKPVLPLLEWCNIPSGMVTVETGSKNGAGQWQTFFVETFQISKYPVTIAQYQVFVNDYQGYANPAWWDFSRYAQEWRAKNPQPKLSRFKGEDRPRENVTWYEAVAFCNWLSAKTSLNISLPTEQQWQRSAQGDNNRLYPWGDVFESDYANTGESRVRMTTLVTRYRNGVSPYGVYDLAGNTWEWCLNAENAVDKDVDITIDAKRAVHGGSFIGAHQRAQCSFRFYLSPPYYYATIGFRVVNNLNT
jgi:formylglycine-generating enzyme required for sulfatase activity